MRNKTEKWRNERRNEWRNPGLTVDSDRRSKKNSETCRFCKNFKIRQKKLRNVTAVKEGLKLFPGFYKEKFRDECKRGETGLMKTLRFSCGWRTSTVNRKLWSLFLLVGADVVVCWFDSYHSCSLTTQTTKHRKQLRENNNSEKRTTQRKRLRIKSPQRHKETEKHLSEFVLVQTQRGVFPQVNEVKTSGQNWRETLKSKSKICTNTEKKNRFQKQENNL